jgi:glucokinase
MITLKSEKSETGYAIGVDLGGTFIKSAIVDSRGRILKHFKIETLSEKGPVRVVKQIIKCIDELKKGSNRISGIGLGAPGIVSGGVVKFPPNFPGWEEVDIRKIMIDKYRTEVEIDNDANCAGLAEMKFGQGKKYRNFIFLTLGTGIGGAIVIEGKLYRGETNGAGEFGMTTINFEGPFCKGGNRGSVESYIGRNYFIDNNIEEINKLGKKIDFDDIAKLAARKNKIALNLMKKYGFYLGVGLTNYFNLMDVRTAIVGGGISNAYEYFIGECRKTIRERSVKTINRGFRVLKSEINNNAGVLGAAALILD